jgi:hypothetical protein
MNAKTIQTRTLPSWSFSSVEGDDSEHFQSYKCIEGGTKESVLGINFWKLLELRYSGKDFEELMPQKSQKN